MYNLFLYLSLSTTTFASANLLITGYESTGRILLAVRCVGITTNEVLNLNKLQGTRLPSAFSSLLRPPQFIPCQLIFRILSHREGRTSRTRNGDMNIPGVEYPRAVNLFGTMRMRKVVLFSRSRNESSRACSGG